MRNLDQRILWAHGSPFIVRRVPTGKFHRRVSFDRYGYSYSTYVTTAPEGYVIFAPCGRYLARVKKNQLRRWLNHFGLENLK